jgi:signal transduction histidine kinase
MSYVDGADRARGASRAGRVSGAGRWRGALAWSRWPVTTVGHAPLLVGSLLAALAVAETFVRGSHSQVDPPFMLTLLLLAVVATLPLALLWRQPSALAAVTCLASVLAVTPFHLLTAAGVAADLAALHRLGRRGSPALAATLAMPFLVLALTNAGQGGETQVLTVLAAALAPVAAWSGIAWRARREAAEHSAARQVIAGSLLEHTARGERARISRELHDVVAHHISMIAVQAESARLTTPGMPAEGAQRLSSIGDTARAALTEMRRLLGVLREDTRDDPLDRQPQPGLRQLNELLDASRDATGAGARLIVSGWLAPLDPGVELAAYRIVQEALTNARRHAPGAAVDVQLTYAGDVLHVRVRDNGPGPAPGQASTRVGGAPDLANGHGLAGMRERAAAVGGELCTRAAPGGGFLVEARLPAKAEEGS